MKILGVLLGVLLLLTPMVVGAESCCDYESCCWRMCCEGEVYWYRVSYFEKVESGFYTNWGAPMYAGVWTHEYVEARNSEKAAESLGMRAGYSCFVARVLSYEGQL